MPTIAEAFQAASHLHQASNYKQAEAIYRQILAAEPKHADALHFLGVLAVQVGKADAGIDLIQQSISLLPTNVAYRSNLGSMLQNIGRFSEAAAAYERANALQPDDPQLINLLAYTRFQSGDVKGPNFYAKPR